MESFIDIQPSLIDRFRWFFKGYQVLCNNCWWVGPDENHDQCPDCGSDRLEYLIGK